MLEPSSGKIYICMLEPPGGGIA